METTQRQKVIAELRAAMARIQPGAAPVPTTGRLATGLPELDRAVGGWPRPGISELWGPPGAGRLRLLLPAMAAAEHAGVVDSLGTLFPPGLEGVRLDRLRVVQPPPEQEAWAAEQLARSGLFPLVVLLGALRLGRGGARLVRAAEEGGCAVVVVAERSESSLPAALRIQVEGFFPDGQRLRVMRGRAGVAELPLLIP